jgi:hypothetical protein
MTVVEDREVLPVAREVGSKAGPGQRGGQRVGGEARLALLAIVDDRLAGLLEPLDRVARGLILRLASCSNVILPSSRSA